MVMTATMANNRTLETPGHGSTPGTVVSLDKRTDGECENVGARACQSIFNFITELSRRRVGRTATLYTVTFWLVCQVIDVVAPAMSLPDWMLKLIIVLGLALFPIVVVLSWLIDITPHGLVADVNPAPVAEPDRSSAGRLLFDGSLLAAALFIGAQFVAGLLSSTDVDLPGPDYQIAVESVSVLGTTDSDRLSELMVMSLQHALSRNPDVSVVDARDAFLTNKTRRLSSVIVIEPDSIQVTSRLVDNSDGFIIWSNAFEWRPGAHEFESSEIAQKIADSLPLDHGAANVRESTGGGP